MILWLHLWSAINVILSSLYFLWIDSWIQRLDKIQIQFFCSGGFMARLAVGTTYWKRVMPLELQLLQHNVFCVVQSLSHVHSLRPHGLQHTRLPCPSPFPGACSNSCPLSQWGHPTISSSVVPFSSCLQSFPASGSFLMNWLFTSGGQSIGASASVFPMNIQGWFSSGLTGLISLLSKGLSRVFSNTTVQRHEFLGIQPSLWFKCHIHTWLLEKP